MANQQYLVGAEAAFVASSVGDEEQVVGGAYASMQVAETDEDWVSVRGRFDLALGGGSEGVAGRTALDLQLGIAGFDGADHLFARGGVYGELQGDPLTGLYLLEVPTVFFGYQHHGDSASDPWHFDVGPRASLGLLGSALAEGRAAEFVAAPALGGALLLMGQGITFEVTYMHYFSGASVHLVRGSACLATYIAVCVDTRHVAADFEGSEGVSAYFGVRFGVGLASGVETDGSLGLGSVLDF